jgi:membrane protease YdiL (CAAX protease family)
MKSIAGIAGKILLALLIAIVLTIILSLLAALLVVFVHPDHANGRLWLFKDPLFEKMALLVQMIGFIGAAWVMHAWFERKRDWTLGFKKHLAVQRSMEGLWMGSILITISCGLIWLFGGVRIEWIPLKVDAYIGLLWWLFVFIGVAVNEEFFTRGYIQGLIGKRFGYRIAIGATAIVFALMHAFNGGIWTSPIPIINLLLAGTIFGIARHLSGGLWMPIGMHLSWNFLQGNVYGFRVSGMSVQPLIHAEPTMNSVLSGGNFGAEGSLITTLILLLGIMMINVYYSYIPLSK